MKREYLVVGHPRSGTGYASALFRANGIDVGHEVMGEHGTSNWQFAVRSLAAGQALHLPDNILPSDVEFEQVIHLVRNPVNCINSTMFTEQDSEPFRGEYVNLWGTFAERAVMSVTGWRKLIRASYPGAVYMPLEHLRDMLQLPVDVPPANERMHSYLGGNELSKILSHNVREALYNEEVFYNELVEQARNIIKSQQP